MLRDHSLRLTSRIVVSLCLTWRGEGCGTHVKMMAYKMYNAEDVMENSNSDQYTPIYIDYLPHYFKKENSIPLVRQ